MLAPFQAAEAAVPRSMEITFVPIADKDDNPQVLIEIGGSGSGYNLWRRGDYLYAGVWGKDSNGSVHVEYISAPLEAGVQTARLELDPDQSDARFFLNGKLQGTLALPSIQPHRDRCALGGVLGSTRIKGEMVREQPLPFNGWIRAFTLTSHHTSDD